MIKDNIAHGAGFNVIHIYHGKGTETELIKINYIEMIHEEKPSKVGRVINLLEERLNKQKLIKRKNKIKQDLIFGYIEEHINEIQSGKRNYSKKMIEELNNLYDYNLDRASFYLFINLYRKEHGLIKRNNKNTIPSVPSSLPSSIENIEENNQ
jgi:hypothetical protein